MAEVTDNACPLTCLNRLAPTCVIHRPSAEKDAGLDGPSFGDYWPDGTPTTENDANGACPDCPHQPSDHSRLLGCTYNDGDTWVCPCTRVIPPVVRDE